MTFDNAFIPQTILFFCLGAYFSIHDINPLEIVSKNKKLFLTLFVLCAIADIAMHTGWSTTISLQAHRLSLILNIPALLLMADFCVNKGISSKLLPNAAFIVFAVHYPIVVALRKMSVALFADASDGFHILLYFACVIISTLLSLSIYWLLDRYLPKVKNVLSGNR
jgi:peptidoglycan/LPS O-acetylase OafA/YrhL